MSENRGAGAALVACHPFDDPCDYAPGGRCRNHGGIVPPDTADTCDAALLDGSHICKGPAGHTAHRCYACDRLWVT